MRDGSLRDKFALGIIDKDKKEIAYLAEFEKVDEIANDEDHSLILWKHKQREKHHYIIQIRPAIEKWILSVCCHTQIAVEEFGLPDDFKQLQNITKPKTSLEHKGLRELFEAIKTRQDYEPVRRLIHWITLLRNKNYSVSLDELKTG